MRISKNEMGIGLMVSDFKQDALYIYSDVLKQILSIPQGLRETGGIMGIQQGVVSDVEFDIGLKNEFKCEYVPNTDKLNKIIDIWSSKGITFAGIFHTHFHGIGTLSIGDRRYIEQIMFAMPQSVNVLYFPLLIFPERKVVGYKAIRKGNVIEIQAVNIIKSMRCKK